MKAHGKFSICVVAWIAACVVCCAQDNTPDERALWSLWATHTNKPEDHAAVAAACKEFRTKAPQCPFVIVAQGIEAWRLLESGDTNAAVKIFEQMVPLRSDPLQSAGSDMARAWLTRLDRELVKKALMKIYRKEVEFPASLDAVKTLPKEMIPPLTDRWDTSWSYHLAEMRAFKKIRGQRYVLESTRLGKDSDVVEALAIPYASRINLKPVKTLLTAGKETVQFASTDKNESICLQAGTEAHGIYVAYIGLNIIVLSDKNHWSVMVKPR